MVVSLQRDFNRTLANTLLITEMLNLYLFFLLNVVLDKTIKQIPDSQALQLTTSVHYDLNIYYLETQQCIYDF